MPHQRQRAQERGESREQTHLRSAGHRRRDSGASEGGRRRGRARGWVWRGRVVRGESSTACRMRDWGTGRGDCAEANPKAEKRRAKHAKSGRKSRGIPGIKSIPAARRRHEFKEKSQVLQARFFRDREDASRVMYG